MAMTPHLMEEGSTSEHHRELARVVGVVEPGLMGDVPRVVAPREANDAVPCLSPDAANAKPFGETQTRGPHTEMSTALAENHYTQDYALDTNGPAPKGGSQSWRRLYIKQFGNRSSKERPTYIVVWAKRINFVKTCNYLALKSIYFFLNRNTENSNVLKMVFYVGC